MSLRRDTTKDLVPTATLIKTHLSLTASHHELLFVRRVAQLIGTRAARLSHCGIAAITKKKNYHGTPVHVGADGTVFDKYPHFKARGAQALREILDWSAREAGQDAGTEGTAEDPIEVLPSEDGSGVGAALGAALTLKRARAGLVAGIKHPQNFGV